MTMYVIILKWNVPKTPQYPIGRGGDKITSSISDSPKRLSGLADQMEPRIRCDKHASSGEWYPRKWYISLARKGCRPKINFATFLWRLIGMENRYVPGHQIAFGNFPFGVVSNCLWRSLIAWVWMEMWLFWKIRLYV